MLLVAEYSLGWLPVREIPRPVEPHAEATRDDIEITTIGVRDESNGRTCTVRACATDNVRGSRQQTPSSG